jgi:anti-anti-sigma factor
VTVISLRANPLSAGERADGETLRARLLEAARTSSRVVLDCSAVRLYTAALLGLLVGALKRSGARPGDIVLCGVDEIGREVFRITRLDTLFPIYASCAEALDAPLQAPQPLMVASDQ